MAFCMNVGKRLNDEWQNQEQKDKGTCRPAVWRIKTASAKSPVTQRYSPVPTTAITAPGVDEAACAAGELSSAWPSKKETKATASEITRRRRRRLPNTSTLAAWV